MRKHTENNIKEKINGKAVIIIGNGSISKDFSLNNLVKENTYLIAVNGGAANAIKHKLLPHLVIGDLDSISSKVNLILRKNNIQIVKYPKEKDATDLELALKLALAGSASEIVLIGVLGKRWDQSVANIFLLGQCFQKQIRCRIVHGKTTIWVVNKSIEISTTYGDMVSLMPLSSQVEGVVTKGLKFQLKDELLFRFSSRGVSNMALENKISISIKAGILLLFHTCIGRSNRKTKAT